MRWPHDQTDLPSDARPPRFLPCGGLQAQRKAAPRQFELKSESPKFWDLFDQAATLQKMAGDFGFTEGPVWDGRGFLYVSDEEKNKIYRVFPDGRKEELLSQSRHRHYLLPGEFQADG